VRSVFYPRLLNGPCGDLRQLVPRDALKITTLFISHAHIDPMVGFDVLLRTFLYHDRTLLVYGPNGIAEQLRGRLSGYTWNLIEGYPLVLKVREWQDKPGREASFRAANAFRPEGEASWGGGSPTPSGG